MLSLLLAACCAPQPASAPPTPGDLPTPIVQPRRLAGPPEGLSPVGLEAWRVLAVTERFTDAAIGYAGATPREVIALRLLWREPLADAAFHALLEQGRLGGRLYALCGLHYTDPAAFERGLASLRGTDARILYQSGCSILQDQPVAELVELPRDAVRLDRRDRTIREWKALDERRAHLGYDIAGGGFPDLFRTGGGYGELREPTLSEGGD